MTSEKIIGEIQRTAKANGGTALGWRKFEEATGIRYYDWYGQFWTRWGDAVREAGFEPNRMSEAYDDEFLLQKNSQQTKTQRPIIQPSAMPTCSNTAPGVSTR
jgi:hypothetical protein